MSPRPLNVGVIGGGKGAFIIHPQQRAVHFDGTRRVTAGALSSNPKVALEAAESWPFPITGYVSYDEMISAQKSLSKSERLDYILIVTPNHVHFDPAMKALQAGIPVFCEKPLCLTVKEAAALVKAVRQYNVPFAVAHTYLGHWTSRFSRYIVRSGLLGEVRWVDSSYIQGWLATKLEATGQTQASWRTNPKARRWFWLRRGHRHPRAHAIALCDGSGRDERGGAPGNIRERARLDDHFTIYCDLSNGGKALVRASQICIGHKNDLGIVIAGSKGTLHWKQEEPESVTILLPGQPDRVYWRSAVSPGDGFLPKDVPAEIMAEPTIPPGHTEGFHDAFARLHRCFEADIRKWQLTGKFAPDGSQYATIEDGWMGMAFLEACLKSSGKKGAWTAMPKKI